MGSNITVLEEVMPVFPTEQTKCGKLGHRVSVRPPTDLEMEELKTVSWFKSRISASGRSCHRVPWLQTEDAALGIIFIQDEKQVRQWL